jgi:hypothetical protein
MLGLEFGDRAVVCTVVAGRAHGGGSAGFAAPAFVGDAVGEDFTVGTVSVETERALEDGDLAGVGPAVPTRLIAGFDTAVSAVVTLSLTGRVDAGFVRVDSVAAIWSAAGLAMRGAILRGGVSGVPAGGAAGRTTRRRGGMSVGGTSLMAQV